MSPAQSAMARRTAQWWDDRPGMIADISEDIGRLSRRADRLGLLPAVRLNGTSDIDWSRQAPELFGEYPDVQFYDYTKRPSIAHRWADGELPHNYHLTFSRSETNESDAWELLHRGVSVSVVVRSEAEKQRLIGSRDALSRRSPWVDGDRHDLTFLWPNGSRIALRAKGRAVRDTTGFVVDLAAGGTDAEA